MLVKIFNSAHYRDKDGNPVFEVPKKSGDGMRPVNKRDAMELKLYPSVTTIDRIVAKEGLNNWKLEQAILAAVTLPRLADETDDAFVGRVVSDMGKEGSKAAELGSEIHEGISASIGGENCDNAVTPWANTFMGWYYGSVSMGCPIVAEKDFTLPKLGYSGRIDLFGKLKTGGVFVADIKTQNKKDKEKFNFYPSWGRQLAAYAEYVAGEHDASIQLFSVVLSTVNPERLEVKNWTDERGTLMAAFMASFVLWKHENGWR